MNGTFESDEYLVNVRLSNNCVINSLRVSSTPATNVDFIIGTDILSRGDLSIENSSGKKSGSL